MKVLIQGRKNGYTILYPRPTPKEFYSFASDIQSISANNYDVYYGKNFYTLAFVIDGCIFSKYVIGDDVGRGQLGEIGISVFIPNTRSLSGVDIKTLLDELLDIYCNNYILGNKITEPKNGFDWTLFTNVADGYDSKLRSRFSIDYYVKTGAQDPAYYYYKSNIDLIDHFDKPFQEEYDNYKQIIFVDIKLQGQASPLNVIMNSGIELKPDLKNQYYHLSNYDDQKPLIITTNGKQFSNKNNKIRSKWPLELNYSKDGRCYYPINAGGTLSDETSEIFKYLKTVSNEIIINYDAFKQLPKEKKVLFEIKDRKGKVIEDCDVEVIRKKDKIGPARMVTNNYVDFYGEELTDLWVVKVRKGDLSGNYEFIPDASSESVRITVEERIHISFNVKDQEGKKLTNFDVQTYPFIGHQVNESIEFVGEQTSRSYDITILKNGYHPESIHNLLPVPNDIIDVTLKRKQTEFQEQSYHNRYIVEPRKQNSLLDFVKSFLLKPKHIVFMVAFISFNIAVISVINHFKKRDQAEENEKKTSEIRNIKMDIEKYIAGDSIQLEKLVLYKNKWEKQEQSFIRISKKGWFGGKGNAGFTDKEKVWLPMMTRIDSVINKRKLIDSKNFKELKGKLDTTSSLLSLKTAIAKIDSSNYNEIGDQLDDVSAFTLTQIADSINSIIKAIELDRAKRQAKLTNSSRSGTQAQNANLAQGLNQEIVTSDKTSKIIQYIQGRELDVDILKEYKEMRGISKNLQRRIQLCLDFWELKYVASGPKKTSYYSFFNKNKEYFDKNSKLYLFLDSVSPLDNPSYTKSDKRAGLRKIK